MKWRVKYTDLLMLRGHRPFYKLESIIEASSRKEAIEIVKDRNYYGEYGDYKASKIKGVIK